MSTQFLKIHPRLIKVMEFFLLLVKKSQIETDENEILLLEDFFGINVSTSHPLELISDIETFLITA